MSKKLNIIEAMKMPIGTLFEVILNGEEFGCVAKILESSVQSKKQLVWDNRANSSIVVTDAISRAIFTPIQQPVSFMEIVKTKRKVKVECDKYFNIDEYRWLHQILQKIIENNYGNEDKALNDFITKGKWYIEESEDDSNE